MTHADALSLTIEFLREIGLAVSFRADITTEVSGFIPHVRITDGCLEVDSQCPVSNLLHEAGHLACTPSRYRPWMDGNLYAGQRAMLEDLDKRDLHPDNPEYRAAIQCSDPEATAWAWAAGSYLGLPEDRIILDTEYDGEGESLRLGLSVGAYLGIHGLAHAGFCTTKKLLSPSTKLPAYPALAFWLQK